MHLVCFIIRIYHDARSIDRQNSNYTSCGLAFRTGTAAFWVITQRVVVISYQHFGTIFGSIFRVQESKMIGRDYHYLLCNNQEWGSSQLLRGESPILHCS